MRLAGDGAGVGRDREQPGVAEESPRDSTAGDEGERRASAGDHPERKGLGSGLLGWTLRGATSAELDGLPTSVAPTDALPWSGPDRHPSGVTAIDHVVAITPALERTVEALQAAGLDLRRIREEPTPAGAPRQAFFRLGAEILEVVQEPADAIERGGGPDRPAFFWGLALRVHDLDAAVAGLGDRVSPARKAVQPGRRIATLGRAAGLSVPVALMTP